MLKLLETLSVYIQLQTGLAVLPDYNMPEIRLASPCEIIALMDGPSAKCDLTVTYTAAVYMPATNRVYLADTHNVNSPADRSILLHELVHAQQQQDAFMSEASCIEREMQAYTVQWQWVQETTGLHPSKVIGLQSPTQGAILSCAGQPGP